jgi:hypothetical protein
MTKNLTYDQLATVLRTVFGPREAEADLTFLVDLPNLRIPDSSVWADRRRIAIEWFTMLQEHAAEWPFRALNFCTYENVGSNNADLPAHVTIEFVKANRGEPLPVGPLPLTELLARSSIVLAPTELSATAPLKILARSLPFRGATLPNFQRNMLPALGLDYEKIDGRVREVQTRMSRAETALVALVADGKEHRLTLDLRHRTGHASGGLLRDPGTVGNLPSGEAYIVPYEGEKEGVPSKSEGTLPVQFYDEIVLFRIRGNRAVEVISSGTQSDRQRGKLSDEPAYGNLAELGVGVLGELGISAVGSTLLDEKLGLHVAFGRSDHFGGATSPSSFRRATNVVHADWVYVPSVQPRIAAATLEFCYPDGTREMILRDGRLVI